MADSFESYSGIPNVIQKWASRSDKLTTAIYFKGGWEGWAQVEIAYEMVQLYSTPMISDQHRQGMKFDIRREERVYLNKPNDQVDVVISMSNELNTDARSTYLIELKCESPALGLVGGDDDTLKNFKEAVKKDSKKVDAATGIKQEYLARDGADLYSIVICVSAKGDQWMESAPYGYTRNGVKQGGSGIPINVWWKVKRFPLEEGATNLAARALPDAEEPSSQTRSLKVKPRKQHKQWFCWNASG